MRRIAFALLVIVMFAVPATAVEEVGPPEGAIQIMTDGGFEDLDAWPPWTFIGDAWRIQSPTYEGDYAAELGTWDAWGMINRAVVLSLCEKSGPVWVTVACSVVVVPPQPDLGFDISEMWLANSQGVSLVTLMTLMEEDYLNDASWHTLIIQVDGLWEALGDDNHAIIFFIGASTNETPTMFFYDNIEFWCVPDPQAYEYGAYLPIVIH